MLTTNLSDVKTEKKRKIGMQIGMQNGMQTTKTRFFFFYIFFLLYFILYFLYIAEMVSFAFLWFCLVLFGYFKKPNKTKNPPRKAGMSASKKKFS